MSKTFTALLFWIAFIFSAFSQSWEQVLQDKQGRLDVLWYESHPFIYPDNYPDRGGPLTGLEYDIMGAFSEFVKTRYGVELDVRWEEGSEFYAIIDTIADTDAQNLIGVSAFSITDDRKERVWFTPSYMPDITVLVSSEGTSIVSSYDEMEDMINGMTAITIKGTVYENFLNDLREKLDIPFEIKYISSDNNVLDHISHTPNSFGFMDLPIYLLWFNNQGNLVRQNYFTVYGQGYGFILPLKSDWSIPFQEFMSEPGTKTKISEIIAEYIGPELYEFIGNLEESELLGTSILTKEKEIQLALIENANLRLEEERLYRQMLLAGIGVAILFLVIIAWALYINRKNHKVLLEQKEQIELQQADIQRKNDQLINRNAKLLELNEDKNYLMSILAHDLSSPLTYIMGMSEILVQTKAELPDEQRAFLRDIHQGAQRMNEMIVKLLKNRENNKEQGLVIEESVDLSQIMRDVFLRYKPIAARKGINLLMIGDQESYQMQTDYLLLLLILENLVSNAIKFSPANTEVKMEKRINEREVIFVVSDQGPGFTEEDKKHMYNRLQKLSAQPTANESSTGLGLSIVKKYVNDLEGTVWLESEEGAGSTFYISFPLE